MTPTASRYTFGELRVDLAAFRVERLGMPIELEPKAFDLLVLLIQSRPDVVTKPEIFDRIWNGLSSDSGNSPPYRDAAEEDLPKGWREGADISKPTAVTVAS
jgi:hypothetical protein